MSVKFNNMKKLFLFTVIIGLTILSVSAQNINLSANKSYNGFHTSKQDFEATELLYNEINFYRARNGVGSLSTAPMIVDYACRWGNYMVYQHKSEYNNFYEHSSLGPQEFHIPASCSEVIHLIYFDHQPSSIEIVSGLMYGIARSSGNVIGWIQSPDHNASILQKEINYYGASIYVARQGSWYIVYGTVNFSIV